jgi:DNA-binding Xre family transcriptional regulator
MKIRVSYRWHLRSLMAGRGMFATSDLVPLLASRGVVLSREQVYRLVAGVPERLSLVTLAALCDIFDVSPAELIEPVREETAAKTRATKTAQVGADTSGATVPEAASVSELRPRRARVALATR